MNEKRTGHVNRVRLMRFTKTRPVLFDLFLHVSFQKFEILVQNELMEILEVQ